MDTTNKSILLTGASGGIGRRDFYRSQTMSTKAKLINHSLPYRYRHSAVSRWCSDSHPRGSGNCW